MSSIMPLSLSLPGNIWITVPPHLSCLTTYVLLEQEDWFEEDIAFIRTYIKPGMAFVDVGANFGVYTLTAAACVGPKGRVWAIEPAKLTAQHLQHSIHQNNFEAQTHVITAALSNQSGIGFLAHGDSEELHRLDPNISGTGGRGEETRLATLDELCQQHNINSVDFLKLDAEGHEIPIIEGATEFFAANKPLILLEVVNKALEFDAIDALMARGHALFHLIPGINMLVPVTCDDLTEIRPLNAYLLHPNEVPTWQARGAILGDMQLWPEDPQKQILQDYWQDKPWAAPFIADWLDWPDQNLVRILCLLRHAKNPLLSGDLRYGCLLEARALMDLPPKHHEIGLWLAWIDWCMMTGRRVEALREASNIQKIWETMPTDINIGPFTLPLDGAVGANLHETVHIGLLHLMDRLMHRSTIYHPEFSEQFGRLFQNTPGYGPADERQFLLSRAFNAKAIPNPWPASEKLRSENPNSAVWRNEANLFF